MLITLLLDLLDIGNIDTLMQERSTKLAFILMYKGIEVYKVYFILYIESL